MELYEPYMNLNFEDPLGEEFMTPPKNYGELSYEGTMILAKNDDDEPLCERTLPKIPLAPPPSIDRKSVV